MRAPARCCAISWSAAGGTSTVAFSPDGQTIVTGSVSRKVRIWDASGKKPDVGATDRSCVCSRRARWHRGTGRLQPDGRRVASAGGGTIKLWDVEAGKLQEPCHRPMCRSSRWPSARMATPWFSGGSDQLVHIWDAGIGPGAASSRDRPTSVTAVAFRADGRRAPCGRGRWGRQSLGYWFQSRAPHVKDQPASISSDSFIPDGEALASAASREC